MENKTIIVVRIKYAIAEFLSKGEKVRKRLLWVMLHYIIGVQHKQKEHLRLATMVPLLSTRWKTSIIPSRLVKAIGLLITGTTSSQSTASSILVSHVLFFHFHMCKCGNILQYTDTTLSQFASDLFTCDNRW